MQPFHEGDLHHFDSDFLAGIRSDDWTDLVRSDGPQFARGSEFTSDRAWWYLQYLCRKDKWRIPLACSRVLPIAPDVATQ